MVVLAYCMSDTRCSTVSVMPVFSGAKHVGKIRAKMVVQGYCQVVIVEAIMVVVSQKDRFLRS